MNEARYRDYQIIGDGRTVWVNSGSSCVGRFGVSGIDIHRPVEDQSDKGECLFCTHERTTVEDWDLFVVKMKEFYGVEVAAKFRPTRFSYN